MPTFIADHLTRFVAKAHHETTAATAIVAADRVVGNDWKPRVDFFFRHVGQCIESSSVAGSRASFAGVNWRSGLTINTKTKQICRDATQRDSILTRFELDAPAECGRTLARNR